MNTIKRSYTIDFEKRSNNFEILHQGKIKTDEIKKFGILRQPNYVLKEFAISDLNVPDSIKTDSTDIVFIRCKGKDCEDVDGIVLEDLSVKEYDMPYEIIFNRAAITDYSDFSSETATITFSLTSQGETESKPSKKLHFELDLSFRKGVFKPELNLMLEDDFDTGKQYINSDNVKIADFNIELKPAIGYASSINHLDAKCYLKQIIYSDIVYFGEVNEITEAAPWSDDSDISPNKDFSSKLMKQKQDKALRLANITPDNKISVPVYIDLSRYPVPRKPETEEIIINITYSIDGKTFSEEIKKDIVIVPNTTETDLVWECNDGGNESPLEESFELDQPIAWVKDEDGGMDCFTLKLGNRASEADNGGKVIIKNFNINFVYDDDKDFSNIKVKGGSTKKYTNDDLKFFKINGNDIESLESEFIFNDGSPVEELTIGFNNNDIINISDGLAKINAVISFNYTIIKEDNTEKEGNVKTDVKFYLEKYTGDHWVAVDYGTAASVGAFADSEAVEMKSINKLVLNLQKSLEKNLKRSGTYSKDDIKESDTKFISSEILLRPAGDKAFPKTNVNGTKFDNNIVELSPTNSRITASNAVLPYLKSLIGSKYIPNLNGFEYKKAENEIAVDNATEPLLFNTVLSNTYQSLISDFVLKAIDKDDKEKANKIIFTIPNTFTPKHTKLIKKVVEEKSTQFNKHYISFVSESDAVLSYYLKSWSALNKGRANIERFKSGDSDEYVFIYDMGAGTLDITYAKISRDNNGQTNVDIIGRLGSTSAGNYFDAVVAKAVNSLDNENFFGVKDFFQTDTLTAAQKNTLSKLKEIIRKEVKPLLNIQGSSVDIVKDMQGNIDLANDSTTFPFDNGSSTFNINIEDILNSEEVANFIYINSKTLLNEFFSLYSDPERNGETLEKGNFRIDTVMFTGRSIQFDTLRQAVRTELTEWVKSENDSDIFTIYNPDSKELKNIVVKGALQYATSYHNRIGNSTQINNRNIQARYGILSKDHLGAWKFDEFINPATKPAHPNSYFKDGITIFHYDTEKNSEHTNGNKIDLSHSPVAFFVQSYSSDTAKDANENRWEFITKMFSIKRESIRLSDKKRIPLRVVVDEDNNMIVKVGPRDFGAKEPLSIDTDNNNTFKMSMWPYM